MDNKNIIYGLAGLLHDIGKFGQRADESFNKSLELSEQSKKIAGYLCNTTQEGYFTHQHVIWTNNFLEEHKDIFTKCGLLGEGENSLINLAAFHHKPATFEHAIVTLADHWSSGIDRNTERYLEKNKEWGKMKFKSVPMVSVFNELVTNKKPEGIIDNYGYKLQCQNISESIFPIVTTDLDLKDDFPSLWKQFNNEVKNLSSSGPNELVYSLYNLLKKYTWYFPASTMDYPNSSLFEHMKLTGAFAHCFAEYFEENKDSFSYKKGGRISLNENVYPVLMLYCDVSGIQNFIYNISNKSAMKSLKGRSFYIQLLTETLSEELLELCELSIINQIYSAGGKFYVLLPNTEKVIKTIEKFKKDIQGKLWTEYQGKVSVNIGYQAFSLVKGVKSLVAKIPNDDAIYSIGELWHLLANETSKSKKSKYNEVIKNNFTEIFEPIGEGGDVAICSVTGEELTKKSSVQLDKKYVEQQTDTTSLLVSKSIYKQIQIGESLYKSKYLIHTHNSGENTFSISNSHFILSDKINHSVIKKSTLIQFENEPNFINNHVYGTGYRFYGGIPMVVKDERTATLQDLCLLDHFEKDEDYTKLAVLRMDVDNLGLLFQKGFGDDASFSKMATLSSLLEQFFSGYINTIKSSDEYKNHVNIVYSGGDDIFAVGRWDKIIDFAYEVRKAFQAFVCNREDITLSAGIVIVNPKFPIAKAAELSADAEHDAKDYIYSEDIQKDAINLFGISVNWQHEMPIIEELKDKLVNWIEIKGYLSKGVLMKMFEYYALHKQNNIEWRWQAAYAIARQEKSSTHQSEKGEVFATLKNILFTNRYSNQHIRFEAFILACRWAEMEIKIKNQ